MKWILAFCFALCAFIPAQAKSITVTAADRIDFRKEAVKEDFNTEELELLHPIIVSLQTQYDAIYSKAKEGGFTTADEDSNLKALLDGILQEFIVENDIFEYDTQLPNVGDLRESLMKDMSSAEAHDMVNILQESIDEAHKTIQTLVDQSDDTEALLISINKIKILKFLYRILGNIFAIATQGGRAAYCVYSHIPLFNSTLRYGRENVGSCYLYTRNSIRYLRGEVQSSINIIRGNIVELIAIYKKVASRESILGKVFSLLMNVQKILNDITETSATATKTIDILKTEVPTVVATSTECATASIPSFAKQLNETITGLVTCVTFIDDTTWGPEPEPESSEEDSDEDLKFAPNK